VASDIVASQCAHDTCSSWPITRHESLAALHESLLSRPGGSADFVEGVQAALLAAELKLDALGEVERTMETEGRWPGAKNEQHVAVLDRSDLCWISLCTAGQTHLGWRPSLGDVDVARRFDEISGSW
jgi:hypothetical protein